MYTCGRFILIYGRNIENKKTKKKIFSYLKKKKSALPPSVLETLWGTVGAADGMILPGLLGASP